VPSLWESANQVLEPLVLVQGPVYEARVVGRRVTEALIALAEKDRGRGSAVVRDSTGQAAQGPPFTAVPPHHHTCLGGGQEGSVLLLLTL
jgi:hypothetical protein